MSGWRKPQGALINIRFFAYGSNRNANFAETPYAARRPSVGYGTCCRAWHQAAVAASGLFDPYRIAPAHGTPRRCCRAGYGRDDHHLEIKSSVADFRADAKWREYRAHCDKFYFAIPESVPVDIMPEDAGLILADAYGGDILRQAPEHRMAPATRRAVLMRFAHAAAHRLHRLSDPGGWRRAAGALQEG